MNDFAGGNSALDGVQNADELLMAVALQDAADDLAVERAYRCKLDRLRCTLLVVGCDSDAALLNDSRLGHMPLRHVPLFDERAQMIKFGKEGGKRDAGSATADSHTANPSGFPNKIRTSEALLS